MATTIATRPIQLPESPSTPPTSPHLFLASTTNAPNKHLEYPRRAPTSSSGLPSPPDSPSSSSEADASPHLYPSRGLPKVSSDPVVYGLTAQALADAVEDAATQPLPEAYHVFPWLHGLSARNQMQLSFFKDANKNPFPGVPDCLRGITIVKAGGDLESSKLKGAISPEELLMPLGPDLDGGSTCSVREPCFIDHNPQRCGVSIRNFKIQCCKMATVSDIVVYGDDQTPRSEVEALASLMSQAQASCRKKLCRSEQRFNTFLLVDSFATIERDHPALVAYDKFGNMTGNVMDFSHRERVEMAAMTKTSEIAHNVFMGPSPPEQNGSSNGRDHFDVWIEASDYARLPETETLDQVEAFLTHEDSIGNRGMAPLEFPSSGSFGNRSSMRGDADAVVETCQWIHKLAIGAPVAADDSSKMDIDEKKEAENEIAANIDANSGLDSSSRQPPRARRIFIHCGDGYTESSLLGLAYLMFTECISASEAWVRLHVDKSRNFFAYPTDKHFLEYAQSRLMRASPSFSQHITVPTGVSSPAWMKSMDGSLPSRILPYLYLGNLVHASNPALLRRLGITHILSVGEPITWNTPSEDLSTAFSSNTTTNEWPPQNFLYISKVQDNGLDPLTNEFDRCLAFIEIAQRASGKVLVHCHRGVSRSATICIAEVMRSQGLSFPRAYCYTRARRLNVIIQPHLLFAYELLKWEEILCRQRGVPFRRECEWAHVAREIAVLNRPYCRD